MVNWSLPIRLRGFPWPVRFLNYLQDNGQNSMALCAYKPNDRTAEMVIVVNMDGRKMDNGSTSEWDIINGKQTHTFYQCIYKNALSGEYYPGKLFKTETEAKNAAKGNANSLVTIQVVTFED
jgi:hypothetical protein